ncbi:MAG: ASPIC/UnbV domain-containing protein, partial [Longimicrobiales bacterium]
NDPDGGGHPLYRNLLPEDRARRSLQVQVLDAGGVNRFPGSEVRVYAEEDAGAGEGAAQTDPGGVLLGTGLIDVGGGYCSQGAAPVHFGIPVGLTTVTVEVTVPDGGMRRVHTVRGVPVPLRPRGVLEVRLPEVF